MKRYNADCVGCLAHNTNREFNTQLTHKFQARCRQTPQRSRNFDGVKVPIRPSPGPSPNELYLNVNNKVVSLCFQKCTFECCEIGFPLHRNMFTCLVFHLFRVRNAINMHKNQREREKDFELKEHAYNAPK